MGSSDGGSFYACFVARRVCLWCDSLRMHGGTTLLPQLSLPGLSTRDWQRVCPNPGRAQSDLHANAREPKYFELTADSGQTTSRAFCPECGSRLFGQPGSRPDIVTIRVGSLDDPSKFQPDRDIYVASAQPWDYMNPDLPKFPKLPEV